MSDEHTKFDNASGCGTILMALHYYIIATYLSQQPDNYMVVIIPDTSGMRKVGQGIWCCLLA